MNFTKRQEYRLVRVQGGDELEFAKGSLRFIREQFARHSQHQRPKALAELDQREPVVWEERLVEVTERVISRRAYTSEEVETARHAALEELDSSQP